VAAQFVEEVGADAGEKMVARERGFGREGIHECEAGLGPVGHGHGYGTVEFDDGGWSELGELRVEHDDALPVRFGWRAGASVAGGDLGLQEIGAAGGGDFMSAFDRGEPAVYQDLIPLGAVLIEEQDWFAGGIDAGAATGGLDLHEGDQAVDFRFLRSEFGKYAAEAERVLAEGGAHEVVPSGGGVALVEDQIDDFEDGGEPDGKLGPARDLEGDVLVGEGTFGADDALGDGGFGGEEGAGDLVGGESAQETEGEGGAGLGGEDGMAGNEDETEKVVADGVVERGVEVGRGLFEDFEFAGELFVFSLGDGVAAEEIDGAAFGGRGEPCRRIIGHAGLRPLLERSDERFLREVFGEADVTGEARESGDDARGLDAPNRFDGAAEDLM